MEDIEKNKDEKLFDENEKSEEDSDTSEETLDEKIDLHLEKETEKSEDKIEPEDTNEELLEELKDTKDKLLRSLAENENVRKQIDKIRIESVKYGNQPLARELLSVVDNFDRAIKTHKDTENQTIIEGFELIKKELSSIFDKFNIKKVKALGESFDANYHQAMFEKSTTEFTPGVVCEIIQEGYLFHDRLLRPALVGVAKKDKEKTQHPEETVDPDEEVENQKIHKE